MNSIGTAFLLAIVASTAAASRSFYTAAVFEHTGLASKNASIGAKVAKNLYFYKRAAEVAAFKQADVIVFPEYGILPYGSRQHMKPFLENVPDPRTVKANPCSQPGQYADRPILYTLSCIAQHNSLYVVANMGDIQSCEGDPDCPSDGTYHYNTNVVFDRSGNLLVKYHKEHPFIEIGIDIPKEKQVPVFKTDFGKFATYICFDIVFKRMSEAAEWPSVEGIMFSTMWEDALPQFVSVQFFQAWAMGHNTTLLAANRQVPVTGSTGSGIFHGTDGALAYTFNPDGISKLVVARIAKSGAAKVFPNASITAITANDTWPYTEDGKDVPSSCFPKSGYHCMNEPMLQNYTLEKLEKSSGNVTACNNGLCCTLSYSTRGLEGQFYLGVFNGTYNILNMYRWCEEECVLVRCDDLNGIPCARLQLRSSTIFEYVWLRASITTQFTYPSAVSSGIRLVPATKWKYELVDDLRSIQLHDPEGSELIFVGMKGRCYNKDPPFKETRTRSQ